jgi:hypothetical protein
MTIDTRTDARDGTRFGALWTGVLLGPVATLAALEIGYVLVERACATGQMLPVHLTFAVALLVSLAGGGLAFREWRAWGSRLASEGGGREGRSRFLAILGVLSGPTSALVVLALWSAVFYYHPCQ